MGRAAVALLLLLLVALLGGHAACSQVVEAQTPCAGEFRTEGGHTIMSRHVRAGSGAGAPSAAPLCAGDFYQDTTSGVWYRGARNGAGALFWERLVAVSQVRGFVPQTAAATLVAGVLTANANGLWQTGDPGGVTTWAAGDLVLVGNVSSPTQCGLYRITNLGAVGAPWVLTRTEDASDAAGLYPGRLFYITEGTALGALYMFSPTVIPYTIGVTGVYVQNIAGVPVVPSETGHEMIDGKVVGVTSVVEVPFAAGGGGAPDDVNVLTAVPWPFTIEGASIVVSANVVGSSCQLRSAAGGGGAAYSGPIGTAALGRNAEGTGGGFTALGAVPAGGSISLRRSDSDVAGTLVMYIRRNSS